MSHLPALESALSARGELIERPIYTKASEAEKGVADTDGPGDDRNSDNDSEKRDRGGDKKKNYEATSDSES